MMYITELHISLFLVSFVLEKLLWLGGFLLTFVNCMMERETSPGFRCNRDICHTAESDEVILRKSKLF
jgi:hypothetical protein